MKYKIVVPAGLNKKFKGLCITTDDDPLNEPIFVRYDPKCKTVNVYGYQPGVIAEYMESSYADVKEIPVALFRTYLTQLQEMVK